MGGGGGGACDCVNPLEDLVVSAVYARRGLFSTAHAHNSHLPWQRNIIKGASCQRYA